MKARRVVDTPIFWHNRTLSFGGIERSQPNLTVINATQAAHDALRQNPLWLQTFERNAAVQLLIDPATRLIIDANPAACRFYGYARELFRGLPLDTIEMTGMRAETEDEISIFDFQHRMRSGQVRQVRVTGSLIESPHAMLMHMIIFDITKRRRAEAAEYSQRVLASALVNTAAALVDTLDLPEVLDRILAQVQHIFPNDYINVMLIEGEHAAVVRARGYERVTDFTTYADTRLDVYETPTLRWMMEHKQSLVIQDIDSDTRWTTTPNTQTWLKSYLGAPIRMGGIVIGFLNFDSSVVGRFIDYDNASLQAFADQAGIAIRNARLFERVRKQATTMEHRAVESDTQLEHERRLFRTIFDSMTEAVIYSEFEDADSLRPRFVNHAMMRMLGFPDEALRIEAAQEEALQRLVQVDFPAIDRLSLDRASVRALRDKGSYHFQTPIVAADGISSEISITATRVVSADGTLIGAVTVVRDVSQAIALERQRSRFLARASHELRTPLTNLTTRLYLLRRQPERLPQDLVVLEQVTTQMGRLVETLLEMARLERGDVQLRLGSVIAQRLVIDVIEAHRPTIERHGQHLSADLPNTLIHLTADADRLIQVLNNLIANASNYSAADGSITLRLTETRLLEKDVPAVCFEVIDNGIGIPLDQQDDIFKPFYRVVDVGEGVGLGLSIAREIVEMHGGTIAVVSTPGAGSRFSFVIPLQPLLD